MAAEIRTEFTDKKVKLCIHTQIDMLTLNCGLKCVLSHTNVIQVILIHPREEVADPDLLPSVKEQAKQVLLEKGVELLLGNDLVCRGCLASALYS